MPSCAALTIKSSPEQHPQRSSPTPPTSSRCGSSCPQSSDETQGLYYGFPLVAQQKSLIPVCYTQVRAEPGPTPGTVLIRREGELLPNRRFLMDVGDLTDAGVAEFARHIVTGGHSDSQPPRPAGRRDRPTGCCSAPTPT